MARTAKKSGGLAFDWEEKGTCSVRFAEDAFGEGNTVVAELLKELTGSDRPQVMLVADANVVQRTEGLGTRIGRYVQTHGIRLAGAPVVLGGGEKIKCDNQQSVQRIVTAALDAGIGANDVMLILGGGTLQDVAGFAAAQIRGGVRLVRMPTTVAAMLDGAFAETAALDMPRLKDALRVTCRPSAVVIDPSFAKTVLDGVWRGGLGEAVRYAAVCDGPLVKKLAKNVQALKDRDMTAFSELLQACVESRMKKGSTDFALWSAHRLESMSGYKMPHGYAVPIGICIDCAYAVERQLMTEAEQELVCRTLAECGALDGLSHSQHLLRQTDGVLEGLDEWARATGAQTLVMPKGLGKSAPEETPDRAVFDKVIKAFLSASAEG